MDKYYYPQFYQGKVKRSNLPPDSQLVSDSAGIHTEVTYPWGSMLQTLFNAASQIIISAKATVLEPADS